MAAVDVDAQTPRRRTRRAIKLLVVANPDGSSDEDTPAEYYNGYSTSRPSTVRAQSPKRSDTLTSPSPTSYVSASGSSARSSNSPGPESTPPPPTPSQVLPPLDLAFTKPAQKPHVTPNLPVGEDSDNAEAESSQRPQQSPSVRRSFSPSRQVLSPPVRSATERIIVAVTHDAENYVVVDLTGHTEAQAIRERILSKLHIPDDLHSAFSIYRTELGGFAIGGALNDTQLLIDCQHFGDEKGSLKFLAQRSDAPADDPELPVPPPTIAPVPPMLPSLSSFSPGAMRMPSSRRPGSASPASDRLGNTGYEASVSAVSDFDPTDQEATRSPIAPLHRHPASRRGRQPSVSWRIRRRGSGSGTSDMSPVAPGSSPETNSTLVARTQERRGSVTPTPTATRSPPGPEEPHTHARRPSEPDSAYERDLALAAEERRREEERERWNARQKVELAAKRERWALEHPGRTNPNGFQNGYQNGSGYTSGGSTGGYARPAGSVPVGGVFPPARTGSPARTPSGHGRRPGETRPQPYYQQPAAPVRQQDAFYRPQQQQPQRPRQPSPAGNTYQPAAPPPPQPYPSQPQQYPQQYPQPYPQPQQYNQQQPYPRTLPPGPPRGAMLPRTPGAEYIAQPTQPWNYDPETVHRMNAGGSMGPTARPHSPQLRGGARSMGNLRESYAQPPPPPPPPVAQWPGRGPSPGPQQQYPYDHRQETQRPQSLDPQRLASMDPQRLAMDPPRMPGMEGQRMPGMEGQRMPIESRQSMPSQPTDQREPYRTSPLQQPHGSPSHTSPLQQSQTIQQPLPPPSMQQYQQQGRLPEQRSGAGAPGEQRMPGQYGHVEPQRTGGSFVEPQRTGGTFEPQRTSGFEPQRTSGFTEPQRTSGFVEPQRTGSNFQQPGYVEPQKTGGQYAGYERWERERMEREKYERERKEYEMQRPAPSRQPTGTSPNHRQSTEPVPRTNGPAEFGPNQRTTNEFGANQRTTSEFRPNDRPAGEFSTSPRPAAPLATWSTQSMGTLNRPNEPYYNHNGTNPASLARRTFSGDAVRPQSAYETSPNALPASLRPNTRPALQRPVTEYDRPSPSNMYQPPPLPQTPQHTTSPPVNTRYTMYGSGDSFSRRVLDERVDDVYGGMEEPSASPLSVNTSMLAPPPYEAEPGSASPSSVAGEPSPMPRTPEPEHTDLDSSGTASPSVSDASTVGYHARDTDSDRDSTTAVSDTTDAAEGTLKADDYRAHMAAIVRMVNETPSSVPASGAATPPAPAPVPRVASQPTIPPPAQPYVPPAKVISRDFAVQEEEDYDDSDEDGGTLWQVPKQNSTSSTSSASTGAPLVRRTATRPKGLRLRIDGTRPSSGADSSPASTQDSAGGTIIAPTLPLEVRKKTASGTGSGSGGEPARPPLVSHQSSRTSSTWDIRPQAEEVYEKLDQFFPNHDLDRPVIDAPSGGTSPVTTEAPPVAGTPAVPVMGPGVRRHKKSIRVVAAERKKMLERINAAKIQQPTIDENAYPDSDSTLMAATTVPATSILRKRSTKMWGGRVEEVTPGTALGAGVSPNVPETIPEGPGRQRPTFKWVKGQLIGRGSFGRVYHAMNLTTGEMIAVKQVELPKTDSDRADSRQITVVDALKSESDTLRDLDHPHIVQYLGFEETTDAFSIFLEYVPGGSVGSVLRKFGKFEDGVVRSFSHQIIDGLAYLHKSGILHRDLKGDNILVDPSGICKISDFGISKRSEHVYNNHEGTAMQGSVFWMAPEMLHNNKQGYNAKIDIWSVGCVVLEMQAGRRPWTEDDMFAVMYKVGGLRQAPPVPDDVHLTPLADDFRQKCFAVDPAERPTAAELLTHPWLQVPPGWVFKGFN